MSKTRRLLSTAAASALLGCGIYVGADVAGEYTTYTHLRDQALALAEDSKELKEQIGYPFSTGPWYTASIQVSHTGHVASIKFSLQGKTQVREESRLHVSV